MKIEEKFVLKLNRKEAEVLKKLLGNMNDPQFERLGIQGADRQMLSALYDLLPHEDQG